jgi:proteic killer suppression protein
MSIRSFKDRGSSDIANGINSKFSRQKLPPTLHEAAYRKLVFLDNAQGLQDLAAWKGLHLEKLKGDRSDQHSIRINDQFRVCFRWSGTDALDVEITDYH